MGLGNGNPNSGNKGSNYAYELKQVRALSELISSVKALNSVPGGGGSTALLATESTLISVLNAISTSDQDIEILLVRDTGNADQIVQQITNYQTGVPVVSYKDVDGNPYIPVGPLEYLDPSAVLNLMLTELLTLSTPVTGLGMTLFTGVNQSGSTNAGQRSISILNAGANAASVGGGINNLLPGVEVTWEAGGIRDTLGSLTWDGTVNGGTTLIISTVG